jgi:hypothetical protein
MVVAWQMDGVAGHGQVQRKPLEGLPTIIPSLLALLLFALLLVRQCASRPVQILRKNGSPRGTALRFHKQPNHLVVGRRRQPHQSVVVALAIRLVS